MSALTFKGGYELEFAIDSENEFKALNILADIFGKQIKNEVKFYGVAKRSGLIFINNRFTEDELTDEKYQKLNKHSGVISIVNDELSAKRASELLKICIPVETLLKRLLIYVWSEIIVALGEKNKKQAKISVCNAIKYYYLGDLVALLEIDLAKKNREALAIDGDKILTDIINKSKDVEDIRDKMKPYTDHHLVWDQINTVLKNPIDYSRIGKQIHTLKELRDKAAHPQTILKSDIDKAKKCSRHIVSSIGEIRNDYYDELSKSIRAFTKVMSDSFKRFPSEVISQVFSENTANLSNTLNEAISKMAKMPQIDLGKIIKQTNWNAINDEMRASDSEMKELLERFDKNGAKNTIEEMQKEIDEEINQNS